MTEEINEDKIEDTKQPRYFCNRCKTKFYNPNSLRKHLTMRKVRCDNVLDSNYYIIKHFNLCRDRYVNLVKISEIDDSIISFEDKKRVLTSFFKKANEVLKMVQDDTENKSLSEQEIYELEVYIQNCNSGNFFNTILD